MPDWFYSVITIGIIIMVLNALFSKKPDKKANEDKPISEYQYKKVKILTETEKNFYIQLKSALDEKYILLSKVRLWDIIDTTAKEKQYIYTNKIKSKHIDFIISDNNAIPVLAIEIDDNTHNRIKKR